MDPGAEGREHAQPPVADLVAEALHHHGSVVGNCAGGGRLVLEVCEQVGRGCLVEAAALPQPGRDRVGVALGAQLAHQLPHGAAQLDGAARPVAVPERHLAQLSGRGGDHHPVEGDVNDPPGGRAQQERLAHPALVDHFLVEFADPGPVGQEHAEQAPVGDGAGIGDCEPLGSGPAPQHARDPIPHHPGPQLGELLGRVGARQQFQHAVQHLVGQLGEARATPQHG